MTSNWKKQCAALALAAAMTASSVVSPLVYAADAALQADVGSEPAVSASVSSESTGSESTGSESTGSESTGSESTGSESTGSESTGSESTGSESTGSESTDSESTGSESTGSESTEEEITEEESEQNAVQALPEARWSDAAIWHDGFEQTTDKPANANVAATWKNGIVPTGWNEIWLANAPANPDTTYFEVVQDQKTEGANAIHCHSEDKAARIDIVGHAYGLDYSKDYVLRMKVKTENATSFLVRAQIGDKGNIVMPTGEAISGTNDWYTYELPLKDLQAVYDAYEKDKSNEDGHLKIELFADKMSGDVWIDEMELLAQEDADEENSTVLWSNSFDTPVAVTGNSAPYWPDGVGPEGFMNAWVPEKPALDQFMLKLDNTTKVDGEYSLYCKSTAPQGTKQRVKLSYTMPEKMDYTQEYILRAKVKAVNAGNSNWGGATLRVDLDGGSISQEKRFSGTFDWETVELKLNKDNLVEASGGKTSGKLELCVMYEYFTGELWVDDMELISTGYTLTLDQEELKLDLGESAQLTALGAPEGSPIVWTSANPEVASVDENGLVTGLKGGITSITATVDENHTASCMVVVNDPESAKYYQQMRDKWTERLTGNSYWKGEETSQDYKTILEGYDQAAQNALDLLVRDSEDQLFSDLDLKIENMIGSTSTNSDDSVDYSTAVSRMLDMAKAWASKGSRYYQDEGLKADILYAMQWYYDHVYNEKLNNQEMFGNWYHWWIGIPQNLAGTVILMHDEMDPELLAGEAAVLAHFNEDPSYVYKVKGAKGKMEMTSGNLADTSLVSLLRGAACDDQNAVFNGTKYFDRLASVVTSGEGIYADGSFIQHTNLAYTGGYGATLLNGVEKLVYLTDDTAWQIDEQKLDGVYDWIWNGIRPLYANGAMFDMVSGRGIARPSSSDYKTGRGILGAVALMAESAPDDIQGDIKSFAKAQLIGGAAYMGEEEYYSGMNAAAMMAAKSIVEDPSIPAVGNQDYAHVFGAMDKFVAHSSDFSMGISYSSARTGRFEYGNGENKLGWHQSDGVTYIYNGDPDQYADNYWNTVDPQRLPGITTDHSTWAVKDWGNYTGNANYNGGSTVGPYASVAMNFKNYSSAENPNLTARKAWFVFDDEVVALGAGITGIDKDRTTETIVDNKKINGDNQLVVDGKTVASGMGDSEELTDVSWAWMEGNKGVDSMGYYFPEGSDVNVLREERTGSWADINGSAGVSDEPVTRNYLSLAIPHGENVDNRMDSFKKENYDYVLLPSKTQDEVKAYAENPDIQVLSNSTFVQAVRDNEAGVTGYIFWGDHGDKELRVGDVGGVKGSVTIVKDPSNHTMTVGMSDVLQNNDSLTFRIYGNDLTMVEGNPNVTAEFDKLGAVLTVNTKDAKGATFTVTLGYTDLDKNEQDALESMRANYINAQTGNDMTDKTDADYLNYMAKYEKNAKEALDHLNWKAGEGSNLFDDIDVQLDWANKGNNNTDGSANLTATTSRIKDMVLAYVSEGCKYYHDEELKKAIDLSIDYLFNGFPNVLNFHDRVFANWWDWAIGVPKDLSAVEVLMHDELDEDTLARLHNMIMLLSPDVDYYWGRNSTGRGTRYPATGANGSEMAMITLLNGMAVGDTVSMFKATDTMVNELKYVTSGEGFYPDGSFKQHGNFAYNGTYGVEKLRAVTEISVLTSNTPWACADANPDIIYEWILNAYRPLYADGGIFDMVQGRSVSRYNRSNITTGRYAMDAIIRLVDGAPEEYRDELLSFAKTQAVLGVAYDPTSYYNGMKSISSLVKVKNIVADESIPLDTELYTKVYGYMDKAVVKGDGFSLGVSMFSSRNGATECGNGENLKGWYQSDGLLELYNGDQAQHDKGYWATVDPLRLAGITTNHVTKELAGFSIKTNDRDWVGGSTAGVENYASIGQDFKSNYSDLEGKKSWFAFGDQVVALGAGIKSTEGDTVETIVENRKTDNANQLLVNGKETLAQNGETTVSADWAWISANQQGSAIGYYFPETTQIEAKRETRTGKWSDVNSSNFPGKPDVNAEANSVTNDYVSLAVDHGQNPTAGSYGYVLLPGKTAQEMQSYAKNNSISILSNTEAVQAAMDAELGVSGYNFWQAGQVQLGEQASAFTGIQASQPASVTVAEEGGVLTVGISDPTQKNASTVIRLEGEGLSVGQLGEGVTAQADATGVTLTVNTDGGYGQTFTATVYNTAQVIEDTLEEGDDFLNSDVTTADRAEAEALLERLESLDESQLTAEQAARRTRMMEQLSRMLTDMDTVDKVVTDLNGVQEVTGDNLEQVKAMLAAYDGLTTDQKALLTSEQKAVAEKVRDMVKSYEEGIEPTPSPDPTPTPGTDPTPTPAPDPTPTPKPEDKPSEGGQDSSGTNATPAPTAVPSASAQTGDGFRPVALGLMGMASAAAVVVLSVMKKKMSDEE